MQWYFRNKFHSGPEGEPVFPSCLEHGLCSHTAWVWILAFLTNSVTLRNVMNFPVPQTHLSDGGNGGACLRRIVACFRAGLWAWRELVPHYPRLQLFDAAEAGAGPSMGMQWVFTAWTGGVQRSLLRGDLSLKAFLWRDNVFILTPYQHRRCVPLRLFYSRAWRYRWTSRASNWEVWRGHRLIPSRAVLLLWVLLPPDKNI